MARCLIAPALPNSLAVTDTGMITWDGSDKCSYRARVQPLDGQIVYLINRSEAGEHSGRRVAVIRPDELNEALIAGLITG